MEERSVRNIKRGEMFFVRDTGHEWGNEQRGCRPAIIVGNDLGNKYSNTAEVTYLTASQKKKLPTHVPIIPKFGKPSTALCESVCTISKERLLDYIGKVNSDEQRKLDKALCVSLSLPYMEEVIKERDMYKEMYLDLISRITKHQKIFYN